LASSSMGDVTGGGHGGTSSSNNGNDGGGSGSGSSNSESKNGSSSSSSSSSGGRADGDNAENTHGDNAESTHGDDVDGDTVVAAPAAAAAAAAAAPPAPLGPPLFFFVRSRGRGRVSVGAGSGVGGAVFQSEEAALEVNWCRWPVADWYLPCLRHRWRETSFCCALAWSFFVVVLAGVHNLRRSFQLGWLVGARAGVSCRRAQLRSVSDFSERNWRSES